MEATNQIQVKLYDKNSGNEGSKVTEIHDQKVYNDFQHFLRDKKTHSDNTRRAYERDIKDFFEGFLNKDMRYLTENDLIIDKKLILNYRAFLEESGEYQNSTINRKVRALKSLFDTLSSYGYKEININSFLKIRELPKRAKSYGVLTPEEAFLLADIARSNEREKKEIKYFLINTAIRSSLRISDLLALKWDDFKIKDDLVLIEIYEEKTDKETAKPLVREFYDKLLTIKTDKTERVFNIDKDAVGKMMKRITKKMGIDEKRNIKFHSFRNVGINFVLDVTGDIKAAAAQGNHSNINTTYNSYLDRTKNFDNMAGVLMDREMDQSILEKLSKDELMNLINKLSFSSKSELIKLANITSAK